MNAYSALTDTVKLSNGVELPVVGFGNALTQRARLLRKIHTNREKLFRSVLLFGKIELLGD